MAVCGLSVCQEEIIEGGPGTGHGKTYLLCTCILHYAPYLAGFCEACQESRPCPKYGVRSSVRSRDCIGVVDEVESELSEVPARGALARSEPGGVVAVTPDKVVLTVCSQGRRAASVDLTRLGKEA